MKDTIELLQDLLEQHQFELLIPENENTDRLRLVYLMNDAVESFLVFVNVGITGLYQKDYEGELDYSLSREGQGYVLSVWQGKNVVTLFFRKLELEVHLYDYGEIGHFWVKGYEYLRQLEYRIAIIRDKLEYLGEEFCHRGRNLSGTSGQLPSFELLLLSSCTGAIHCSGRKSLDAIRGCI